MTTPARRREPWVELSRPPHHPLIWSSSVRRASPGARAGDIVELYDDDGDFYGAGFYSPKGRYRVRALTRDGRALEDGWIAERLDAAVALRHAVLGLPEQTDAYRVVHAEGDELPGLMVDRFGDALSIEVFTRAWLPLLPELIAGLHERLGTTAAVIQADAKAQMSEGFRFELKTSGAVPRRLKVREGELRFHVDLEGGHKTGFFCDQRENRRELARRAGGERVLDVCTYTGGFALAAKVLGGAEEVVGVDLDEAAVAEAVRNAKLNQVRARFVQADAFPYLRQLAANGERFGVVVVDPPKFIPGRAEVDAGTRKYIDLNRLALELVKPGGLLLTCSCSGLLSEPDFADVLRRAESKSEGRRLQILRWTGAGEDHPVRADCPESRYLKAAWARVL